MSDDEFVSVKHMSPSGKIMQSAIARAASEVEARQKRRDIPETKRNRK